MATMSKEFLLRSSLIMLYVYDSSALDYGQAEAFLKQYMPLRDKLDLSEDFISNNIVQALSARGQTEWAKEVPDDIFLDNVLPYSR